MRKRISLKTRRPGLSPAEFREYYETQHVPLGLAYIDRFQWKRYVRNHIRPDAGVSVPFDCVTEFWVPDDSDNAALDRFVASEEFQGLHADDENFLDTGLRFSGEFEEREIRSAATRGAEDPVFKHLFFWRADATEGDAEAERSRALVDRLGDRVVRARFDRLIGPPPDSAPFDTLLWLELSDEAPIEPHVDLAPKKGWQSTRVEPVETPEEQLYHD